MSDSSDVTGLNNYRRNDVVWFQGERYTVKSTDGLDLLVQNEDSRLRLDFRTVIGEF